MRHRKWLDESLRLDSERIYAILKAYFDENQILFGLTQLELNKIACVFTGKLLNTPDCVTKEFRTLTYREIFEILITVYDSLEPDNDDLTTECYKLTQFFYSKNQTENN